MKVKPIIKDSFYNLQKMKEIICPKCKKSLIDYYGEHHWIANRHDVDIFKEHITCRYCDQEIDFKLDIGDWKCYVLTPIDQM